MTTHRLSTLYDQLSVWERIPLLVSAQSRKDETEYQRLFTASPMRSWRFSEHLIAEQALHVLALCYINEQLDAAGTYFFALFELLRADDAPNQDISLMANTSAYIFTVNSRAWQLFCSELGIAHHELIASNQNGWFLPYCEEQMAAAAPSAKELLAYLQESNKDVQQLITPETVLARWRGLLGEMTHHTPNASCKEAS